MLVKQMYKSRMFAILQTTLAVLYVFPTCMKCCSEIDYCVNNECKNEATCEKHVGGYSCKCFNDTFHGHLCQWGTYNYGL